MVKHTRTIRWLLSTNCSSEFDHFVRLALRVKVFFLVYVWPFFRALSIMRVMLQMLNTLLIISHLTHHQHQNNIYSHSILLLADFRQKFIDWIWTIVYSAVPSDFFGPWALRVGVYILMSPKLTLFKASKHSI